MQRGQKFTCRNPQNGWSGSQQPELIGLIELGLEPVGYLSHGIADQVLRIRLNFMAIAPISLNHLLPIIYLNSMGCKLRLSHIRQ